MVNLLDLLNDRVLKFPEKEILHFLEDGESISDTLTYLQLQEKSQKLAGVFQATGLYKERVLICLPQNLTYFIGLYACIYAGVIAIPAFPPRSNQNLHRLNKILEDAGSNKILIDRKSYDYIKRKIEGFDHIEYIIFEDVMQNNYSYTPVHPKETDIAYLQYTSGSTGSPKGTMITHRNVLTNSEACIETTRNLKKAVTWLPLYHDMGLISWFTYVLIGEVTCYMLSAATFIQSPIKWLKAVSRFKAEFTLAPNFAFDLCCTKIKDEEFYDLDLSSLLSVVCGSEKVKYSTLVNFSEKFGSTGFNKDAFSPSYGLAEATLIVSVNHPGKNLALAKPIQNTYDLTSWEEMEPNSFNTRGSIVSIGIPVKGAEIAMVNDLGFKVNEKEIGEICVHFPGSISPGYWNNETLTDEVFNNILGEDQKRYLRTGDLGFKIEHSIFFVGRKKEVIVIRGRKIYPEDIEEAIRSATEKIEENSIAAISIEDSDDEKLIIIAELKRQYTRDNSFDPIINTVRQIIAKEFEIQPNSIVLIHPYSMDKTTSGKIQRINLKEKFLQNQLDTIYAWSAEKIVPYFSLPEQESTDRDFFKKWLLSKISAYAEFPEAEIDTSLPLKNYPLDSLNAVAISQDINNLFKIKTRPDAFWAFDSIDELIDYIHDSYLSKKS